MFLDFISPFIPRVPLKGLKANSIDPGQTPPNVASVQTYTLFASLVENGPVKIQRMNEPLGLNE